MHFWTAGTSKRGEFMHGPRYWFEVYSLCKTTQTGLEFGMWVFLFWASWWLRCFESSKGQRSGFSGWTFCEMGDYEWGMFVTIVLTKMLSSVVIPFSRITSTFRSMCINWWMEVATRKRSTMKTELTITISFLFNQLLEPILSNIWITFHYRLEFIIIA